jgi:hypothetical protein
MAGEAEILPETKGAASQQWGEERSVGDRWPSQVAHYPVAIARL